MLRVGTIDLRLDRRARRADPSAWSATSTRGALASAHYLASDAGRAMLEQGGNAVDAAVAAAYALAVCEPAASGLGGMGAAVVHDAAQNTTWMLDGACRAPHAATPEAVRGSDRYRGHRSVALPTAPALLERLRERHGRLPLSRLLEPAIGIARAGFAISPLQHELIGRYREALAAHNAAALFLDPQGQPLPVGHVLRQPELATTLQRLAEKGVADFYLGDIGRQICRDMECHGGFLGPKDMAAIPWPRQCRPLWVPFGDHQLCTTGPPTGGLTLAQLSRLWTETGTALNPDVPGDALWLAAMIRRARRDRRRYRLDIGSSSLGAAAALLSTDHASQAIEDLRHELGGGETTHIAAMDAKFAISLTLSIERSFGSACLADGLGFLYNGYLRAFKIESTAHPHFLRPGAVARSNAAPTLVFDDVGPWAALGSTGSERIASGIFLTLAHLQHKSPFQAVAAPRLHASPDGELLIEQARMARPCLQLLERFFELRDVGPYAFRMGGLQLVVRAGGTWTAVADPRRDGAACI
ncbi:MAG: gamma-glutamyltransferase [Myxococcales bacterium]|nr:gamma-glutamyltransferase [Myxococcales bacterium]